MIAAKVKQNANGCTTFLQIVRARYGIPCHLLFTFYAFVCVHVVSGSLVLGAAASESTRRSCPATLRPSTDRCRSLAAVNALTGMDIIACCFLLPVGIAV